MTSGQFDRIDPGKLWVDRTKRQRRELLNIDQMKLSIMRRGLINPPVVTREFELIAGERRWTAVKELGWTLMPVQWADELSEAERMLLELDENIKREDIPWPDRCRAVETYHKTMLRMDKSWTVEKTAEEVGLGAKAVFQHLGVAKELASGNKLVAEAPKFSTARGIVARTAERKKANAAATIQIDLDPEGAAAPKEVPLLHADFNEWALGYTGQPFNFIHCDFPYGINADEHDQGAAASYGGYEDTYETYQTLLETLETSMSNVVADSAHLMFWFAMDYYQTTKTWLEQMGWKVLSRPLIWYKSDSTGVLPDPSRGPRWVYETCFMASRGDRKIVRAKNNVVAWPGRDKSIHMSEKPVGMLKHFMEMFVDEYSVVLDPTAGSANALKAATALGAGRVLGLEANEEFYNRARESYYAE